MRASGAIVSQLQNLIYQITNRIRQSLHLNSVLDTTVEEIRQFLQVDRVKIYQFAQDGSGQVIAEAVNVAALPSLLNLHFPAADIPPEVRQQFTETRLRVIVDVAAQWKITRSMDPHLPVEGATVNYGPVDPCHLDYLTAMGVMSSLISPIMFQGQLWGLLAVHHSQARRFTQTELDTLHLVADQLEIAIAQANLLQQAQQQAAFDAEVSRTSQILHYPFALPDMCQQMLVRLTRITSSSGARLYLTATQLDSMPQVYWVGDQLTHNNDLEHLWGWRQLTRLNTSSGDSTLPNTSIAEELGIPQNNSQNHWMKVAAGTYFPHEQIPSVYTLEGLQANPQWNSLATLMRATPIRSLLVLPLIFEHQSLGYLAFFRRGQDVNITWAGSRQGDKRLNLAKQSFEAWQECRRDQPIPWDQQEIKIVQALAQRLYMSVLQRRIEALNQYQSSHDSLTGLPNRLLFLKRLSLALLETQQRDEVLGILALDINRFKRINDSLGHGAGDHLLKNVAERLMEFIRPCDVLARWGNDEFTLYLAGLSSTLEIIAIAEQIMEKLAEPFTLDDQEICIMVSLGIATAPYDSNEPETLIRCAGIAMQQARQESPHSYHLYTRQVSQNSLQSLTLERDLRRAIHNQEFELYYQPQVDIKTGVLVGLEALIRWHHPTMGFVAPGAFVGLAEETGQIIQIGEWALEAACRQQRLWQQQNKGLFRISVNLSAKQFYRAELLQMVREVLRQTQIPPHCLELEITESAAMEDMDRAIQILHYLQTMGIHIALDDFGTGYSSLTALKYFPINTLKLDKGFVQDLIDSPKDAAIAQTIMSLGHGLGLTVLAEGVETEAQLKLLWNMGCHHAQGYLFSQPLSVESLNTLMSSCCTQDGSGLKCNFLPGSSGNSRQAQNN